MSLFPVNTPNSSYCVHVGPDLLAQVGALVQALASPLGELSPRCAIVTNPTVSDLYAPRVAASLSSAGFEPQVITVPDGEAYKTLETVSRIYESLLDARLDRHSVVFALGGGVVGDTAGFAAATLLRGVSLVQLPTTLLAMIDASIGGKVAVDLPRGKNLVGAFKQPLAVIADTTTLATLPETEWRAGMAEVVKHAIIADSQLFHELEIAPPDSLRRGQWIGRAIQVKTDIVQRDPWERTERLKLNLGHTFGHALESVSGYQLRHGDAVAIGLVCAARLAARRAKCPPQLVMRIADLLTRLKLPVQVPEGMSPEVIIAAMQTDKKRAAGRLQFILPRALGDVMIVDDVTAEQVAAALV